MDHCSCFTTLHILPCLTSSILSLVGWCTRCELIQNMLRETWGADVRAGRQTRVPVDHKHVRLVRGKDDELLLITPFFSALRSYKPMASTALVFWKRQTSRCWNDRARVFALIASTTACETPWRLGF